MCNWFLASLKIQYHVLMETSDFEEVQTSMKVEWKSATIMHGELSVMTPGTILMQEWFADSLEYQQ